MEDKNEVIERKKYKIEELEFMASKIAKSGIFPTVDTPEKAFALMLISESENIHPMKALQRYYLMPSGPTKKAETLLADYIQNGGKVKWIKSDEKECEAEFEYPSTGKIIIKWSIERASKIKTYVDKNGKQHYLTEKDNWINYPESQLRWRTVAEGIRVSNPNITAGFYTVEEAIDFTNKENPVIINSHEENETEKSKLKPISQTEQTDESEKK